MYNSLGAFSNIGTPCNPNTTYKITYYNPSSNSPVYDSSSTSSCYMMQALTNNSIPLNSNISFYVVNTGNTGLTGYLSIPTLGFGQNLYIKDGNNLMRQSQIQVHCNNSKLFDTGTSTLTLNTNSESKHLAYTVARTGGMLLQL